MIKRAADESCTDVHEAPGSPGRSVSESAILLLRLETGTATVGVIGLGYVGLPLVGAIHDKGYSVLGFDTDGSKVEALNAGRSYIRHIPDTMIEGLVRGGRFIACTDFSRIGTCDVLLICVPTPLTRHREPDMTHVVATVKTLAPHLRKGQLVVLESTTYPGTTTEILRPILEVGGLKSGEDFLSGLFTRARGPRQSSL